MFKNMIDKMVLCECECSNNGFFREYEITYPVVNEDVLLFTIRGAFVSHGDRSEHFVKMSGHVTGEGPLLVTCKPCKGYAD